VIYWRALDGVRSLAVIAVLLFHGGVAWLPGGFLGVDAFFVLSGFLITSLLLHEHMTTGRIRLGGFWLRRVRRLLPALVVVLVVVVAVFPSLLSPTEVDLLRTDAFAALLYVANWRMIYRGDGDYFAHTAAPSPLQHTWSLGIEEQFYLVWPLVVVALLAVALRRYLVWVCLSGVALSAVVAYLRYDPIDVNRAYLGTDTRAQALLIGCALAAVLTRGYALPVKAVPVVRVAAGMGLVVTGWLWTHASGTDELLYRGGFAVGGLAVAAVLAHTVLQPEGLLARALGVAPLARLGRISYGVYLWHWPLFLLVNGERTGLTGPALLATRVGLTVAVAALSYVLIEQPIRTGQWPIPIQRLRLRAGARTAAAGGAVVVGASAALILVATAPAPQAPLLAAIPEPLASSTSQSSSTPSPMERPLRMPGDKPRIAFFGDSVAWTLGFYLPTYTALTVTVPAMQGCGIARLPDIRYADEPHTNYQYCHVWDTVWRQSVADLDPDVAVILLDRWELMDRRLDGEYQHVGQKEFDAYLTSELELALSIVGARGGHTVLLTAPYTRRAERRDGSLYPEDEPERVDAWNRLLRRVAEEHPQTVTVIDLNRRVCPDGEFTWSIDDLRIRSDGLHFTEEGVRRWIAPWLMPKLISIAVLGP
jgi:peptidoglycan/LPS O-acetylase OafA/YrhL